jgi:hypothetical protein
LSTQSFAIKIEARRTSADTTGSAGGVGLFRDSDLTVDPVFFPGLVFDLAGFAIDFRNTARFGLARAWPVDPGPIPDSMIFADREPVGLGIAAIGGLD